MVNGCCVSCVASVRALSTSSEETVKILQRLCKAFRFALDPQKKRRPGDQVGWLVPAITSFKQLFVMEKIGGESDNVRCFFLSVY